MIDGKSLKYYILNLKDAKEPKKETEIKIIPP